MDSGGRGCPAMGRCKEIAVSVMARETSRCGRREGRYSSSRRQLRHRCIQQPKRHITALCGYNRCENGRVLALCRG